MKTWRWMLGIVSTMALLAACTIQSGPGGDDDEGSGGSGTGTASGTATGTAAGTATGTAAGTASGTASGTATGGGNCFTQPDFETCANCLCTENQAGCQVYDTALIDHIICGQTCGGGDCADFCNQISADLSAQCVACANGIMDGTPDSDAFVAECQPSADCVSFATDLEMCPQ